MTCSACRYWLEATKTTGVGRIQTHVCARYPEAREKAADDICGEFKRAGKRNERTKTAQRARDEKPRRIRK